MKRTLLRAAMTTAVITAVVAPATAHFDPKPCNGVVTSRALPNGTVIYTDDRSASVPFVTGGVWHYLESNNHPGLQGGGDHAVLGPTGGAFFFDPCDTTHGPGTAVQRGPDLLIF